MGRLVTKRLPTDGCCGLNSKPHSAAFPRGALLIIAFEFLERFSFYSTLSMLTLFLTASLPQGGFGWSVASALTLLGIYSGLMYALPALGGLIADRFLGHQRAILLGGSFMFVAYLLLAAHDLWPIDIAHAGNSLPTVSLGQWPVPADVPAPFRPTYLVTSAAFWGAIMLLITGNALLKATLVIVLGDSFGGRAERREAAYAYYYTSINVGGLIAGITAGSIATRLGWGAAFLSCAIAMGLGIAGFAAFRHVIADSPRRKIPEAAETQRVESGREAVGGRVLILTVFAALLLVYSIGSFQLWGSMSLFIEHSVDRHFGKFLIPTQWFTSVNAAGLIIAAPLFSMLWRGLALRGYEPDIAIKYSIGLFLGAAGLLLFAWAARLSEDGAAAGWGLPAFAIFIQALGEVAAWTSTYGLVYRVAPRGAVAAAMGFFYAATLGLGGYIAGWIGQFAPLIGLGRFFLLFGLVSLMTSAIALILRPQLLARAARYGAQLTSREAETIPDAG